MGGERGWDGEAVSQSDETHVERDDDPTAQGGKEGNGWALGLHARGGMREKTATRRGEREKGMFLFLLIGCGVTMRQARGTQGFRTHQTSVSWPQMVRALMEQSTGSGVGAPS